MVYKRWGHEAAHSTQNTSELPVLLKAKLYKLNCWETNGQTPWKVWRPDSQQAKMYS